VTWFADEVIAPANRRVLRAVEADPLLAPFAYHLTAPGVFENCPEEGLVVIRPVCDSSPDDFPAAWYNEPVLDRQSFQQCDCPPLLIGIDRVAEICSCEPTDLPPVSLLAYLKAFAARTQSTIIFYSCFMWGGDIETERVWVFDDSEVVLVSVSQEGTPSQRRTAILEPEGIVHHDPGGPLVLALQSIKVFLKSPHFTPHTRSFPWQNYKLIQPK
jgi:hypothetical protein